MSVGPTPASVSPRSHVRGLARLIPIAIAAAVVVGWLAVLAGVLLEQVVVPLPLLAVVPGALLAATVFWRSSPGPFVKLAAAITAVGTGAVIAAILIAREPLVAVAIPAVMATAVICAKRPAVVVVTIFALTGVYGTIDAFTPLPTGETVDVLLAGLWISVIWGYLIHGGRRPLWVWPGVALLAFYLLLTGISIFVADSTSDAFLAFRTSAWYLAALLLFAFAPWQPETRSRIARGVALVGLAVGSYACVRLVVGPADQEVSLALSGPNPDRESNLGLLGSFPDRKRLAAWCATMIPFSAATALIVRGGWRVVCMGAVTTCAVALFGTEARFAAVAMVAGVLLLVALYQLSRAFPGLHVGRTLAVAGAAGAVGAGAFALTVGQSEESAERFSQIFTPTEAPTYQKRLERWDDALAVMAESPLGTGLGSVGRIAQAGEAVERIELEPNLDSSYLKIGVEQGPIVMALFVVSLLLALGGLARHAIATADRQRAALGMGSAGALVALGILLYGGFFSEGLTALAGWMIVGLGSAQSRNPQGLQGRQRHGAEDRRPRAPAVTGGNSDAPRRKRSAREVPQPVDLGAQ